MNAEETMPVLRNAHVRRGLEITPRGAAVVVAPGECEIGGRAVVVAAPAMLAVAAAPTLAIVDEPLQLSVDRPAGYARGTRLQGPNARDVNAYGAFVPGSLQIRRAPGGELLTEGEDYLVDDVWGHVGLGPRSRVTAQDTVFASYRYSLMRLDTIQVSPDGTVSLKAGEPHVSAPVPPDTDPGCLALAHVWIRATEVAPGQVWPIAETAGQAVTGSTPGRIPRTLAKLRAGWNTLLGAKTAPAGGPYPSSRPVKIVCWGDSVTAGGNASTPERRYVDVFAAGLRERFPAVKIDVENVSVGGSNSLQWLHPDRYRFRNLPADETPCRFQRVLDAQPDLVTIEFVNDAGMSAPQVEETYSELRRRLGDAEVILITPHFTMPAMMGIEHLWEPEQRPYVLALRDFAGRHGVALADASARWEHLWKEGLPYLTLLHNTVNHPDDRGHRLFAEELWKCFRP